MPNNVIDLTQLLNEKIKVYPDTAPPTFSVTNTVEKDGFAEHHIAMASHTGTHIDAPCHVVQNGRSLDQFPVEKFIGNAIVIDCRGRNEISLEYLRTFEYKITKVDFVLFFTGWQYRWNTAGYFDDCPIPTKEAARYLTGFNLKGVGVDAFSLDKIIPAPKVTPKIIPNHHILLGKEILLIENLTNLDKLPDGVFSFQCFPLKVENAEGSPVRAIAVMDE
ncbi:MAG: cyclase family protein [Bacteroidetes bacterium]|nr:MAG: cyclase family protein [Bacteroidota bacterium]